MHVVHFCFGEGEGIVGTGNLHEQLQRLREALAAEGLFSDARKKPLSAFGGVFNLLWIICLILMYVHF